MAKPIPTSAMGRRRGFTLVELLVVMGIIALLIGLLFPLIDRLRRKSLEGATKQKMSLLMQACDAYQQELRAYPGPLADAELASYNISHTTNMMLGVFGGLKGRNKSTGVPEIDAGLVGQGPAIFGAGGNAESRHPPFALIPLTNTEESQNVAALTSDSTLGSKGAIADRFQTAQPIVYIRAKRGASDASGKPTLATQYPGLSTPKLVGVNLNHTASGPLAKLEQNGELRYADAYLLISAGTDGLFGTDDDLVNGERLK